ncbi:hypothetical protein C6T71_12735, partial [Burkholderia multivorans]
QKGPILPGWVKSNVLPLGHFQRAADKITHAIAEQRLRPTVKDIREFLRCSQRRAMELRRQFLNEVCDAPRSASELAASAIVERRLTLVSSPCKVRPRAGEGLIGLAG